MGKDEKKYLSRDAFLGTAFRTKEVEFPGLGGFVQVRELSSYEVEQYFYGGLNPDATVSFEKLKGVAPGLVWRATLDENGNQLFSGKSDLDRLGRLPYRVISPIAMAIMEISGLSVEDEEEAGEGEPEGNP